MIKYSRFLNMIFIVGLLTHLLMVSLGCAPEQIADEIPDHETIKIFSENLDEVRVINVYLPPAYSKNVKQSYPILYMPDGGIHEDFPHVVNSIKTLMANNEIVPLIVVGIENTVRRRDMTPPTEVERDKEIAPIIGGSANFRAFIRDELKPEIEKRYRGSGEEGIMGESLAGFFVLEFFLLEPEVFDTYIALSPSLWWNDHEYVRNAADHLKRNAGLGNSLYLSSADENDIYPFTDELADILKKEAPKDLVWTYVPRRDLKHSTIYRVVSPIALEQMYPSPDKHVEAIRAQTAVELK